MEMSKRNRLKAALAGKTVDRVPVSFWRHWPGDDQHPESLARVALDFQQRYDLDFIKVPVSSVYCVEDYGIKHAYRGSPIGDREYLERVIKRVDDWARIEPLNIHKGSYGRHLQTLQIILDKREEDTPVIFTIFNPLSMAAYLAGDETLLAHLRQDPARVETGLKALAETCASFSRAVIAEGADGIFLSSRHSSYEIMSEEEYSRFGLPGDGAVLEAASSGWLNVLHIHGKNPMLALVADYKAQVMNWHDRVTGLGLAETSRLFPGALMGGVEQYQTLHYGNPSEVESQVLDAIRQMNGHRLIVGPGCTYPITVPHRNLMAMRTAVESKIERKKEE